MAVDSDKIGYINSWDIDQLVASDVVNVTTGTNDIFNAGAYGSLPMFELQYKPTGLGTWHQMGDYYDSGGLLRRAWSWEQDGVVRINVPQNGVVRYYVWGDKVDY